MKHVRTRRSPCTARAPDETIATVSEVLVSLSILIVFETRVDGAREHHAQLPRAAPPVGQNVTSIVAKVRFDHAGALRDAAMLPPPAMSARRIFDKDRSSRCPRREESDSAAESICFRRLRHRTTDLYPKIRRADIAGGGSIVASRRAPA